MKPNQLPPISGFNGKHRFLSNFYPVVVALDGREYPTVEHAFQAAKTLDPSERIHIGKASSPGIAKRLGREVTLRPGWNVLRIEIMRDLIVKKFSCSELKERLAETSGRELIESNDWGDTFWGVCNGGGQNWLGKILMGVRDELRG